MNRFIAIIVAVGGMPQVPTPRLGRAVAVARSFLFNGRRPAGLLSILALAALVSGTVFATPGDTVVDRRFGGEASCNSASGATASSLCGPTGVAIDAAGHLYVSDAVDSRVLEYDDPLNSSVADRVFGAADFTTGSVPNHNPCNDSGISASSLCFPGGVAVDSAGRLYIMDTGNGRVLEFDNPLYNLPDDPLATPSADRVFGKSDFFSISSVSVNASTMGSPSGAAVDSSGRLYVADQGWSRVLEFENPLTSSVADRVFGQSDFTARNCNVVSVNNLCYPHGVAVDAGHLYVTDYGNNRALAYDNPLYTLPDDPLASPSADRVFGQGGSFTSDTCNLGGISASSLCGARGVAVRGGHLLVADRGNNRVLEYDSPLTSDVAGRVLGRPDFATNGCGTGGGDMCYPEGAAFDSDGDVYVADYGFSRVVEYDTPFAQPQAISFTGPGSGAVGGSATLSATGGASGNPVVFSVDASSGVGVCNVSGTNGTTLNYTAVGVCAVDANQAGNSSYNPAPQVQQSVAIGKGSQTITFTSAAPSSAVVGGSTYIVTATGGASGLPVTFSIDAAATSVCSLAGSTVSFIGAGSCVVDGNQAGDVNYVAAPQAQQSVTVGKGSQAITFSALSNAKLSQSPITVSATASSGLLVTFTTTTSPVCTSGGTNGATITLVATGTCTVKANQAGNANYNPSAFVAQSFVVGNGKADQTISFGALSGRTLTQSPFLVSATASSGLTVKFTTTTPLVCASGGTNGATITLLAPGTCTVKADQPGGSSFNPAPSVTQGFAVTKANQAITFASLANRLLGQSPFTVSATSSAGLTVTFTSASPTVCTSSGKTGATIKLLKIGTCTITAAQAGTAIYNPGPSVTRSFSVQ